MACRREVGRRLQQVMTMLVEALARFDDVKRDDSLANTQDATRACDAAIAALDDLESALQTLRGSLARMSRTSFPAETS